MDLNELPPATFDDMLVAQELAGLADRIDAWHGGQPAYTPNEHQRYEEAARHVRLAQFLLESLDLDQEV